MPTYKTIAISNSIDSSDKRECYFIDPNICPRCKSVSPFLIKGGFFTKNKTDMRVYLISTCEACGKAALLEFFVNHKDFTKFDINIENYSPKYHPISTVEKKFSDEIKKLSPKFVEIYHEAEIAENQNLHEICGMGYRKALEFLVKDYLIEFNPENESTISTELLSASIKRIDSPELKILISRSAWLGNDECHYIRKHEDYNLIDFKKFIDATVYYIQCQLTFRSALEMEYKQ